MAGSPYPVKRRQSRLPLILALRDEFGLEKLAQIEVEAVRQRPVPRRLLARLALEEVGGPQLTPRQRECMVLLTSGLTRKEIAAELGVGPETVKTHLRHAYAKLGVRRKVDAINAFLEGAS